MGPELNYPPLENLVFALVVGLRKLRHYFDAHPTKDLTSHPIRAILTKSDLVSIMGKWYVEFNKFHIEYEPQAAIKEHVLVDFIVKFSDDIVAEAALLAPPTAGGGGGKRQPPVHRKCR